jgi:hypothetical protein
MSLESVRELLESVKYLPASLQLDCDAQRLTENLSGQAKAFCWIATHKDKPGPMTFHEA